MLQILCILGHHRVETGARSTRSERLLSMRAQYVELGLIDGALSSTSGPSPMLSLVLGPAQELRVIDAVRAEGGRVEGEDVLQDTQ